ncbi:dihydrolipoamide dehydrogenase [Arsukibacterium sp. MJ3]|uniref:dihydrolipoyl dehydrogenase n=1 Tax=Arsukibacterium sp. MJ3 TaxID=1632859 RepID=UPI000626F0C0|nr:dihydrolipoyl dehydrogenase [Arsukibacterium sp. MJ3]KKO49868.1 dihydrolipoamide dehydrogenase [Arsukibacterium sp. MJ3]
MPIREVDVAIIGAGTAGMGAFSAARKHTNNLVLIEGGPYGTTCARVGCMPSKLLIAAAEAAEAVRTAAGFGVHVAPPRIDGAEVMARIGRERDRFVSFVLDAVEAIDPAQRLKGCARFEGPHTLQLDTGETLHAARIVVATGSVPVRPKAFDAVGNRLIVNDDVFNWTDLPKAVAVFGGGVLGLEIAQALHRLGVRVRLFGKGGSVGQLSDPAVRKAAAAAIGADLPFDPDADVQNIAREGDEVIVRFTEAGECREERFDWLLAATGRQPVLDGLNLVASGLTLDDRGMPQVDPLTMQAEAGHIFFAGDVAARIPLLHEAADDGRIAGDNAGRFPETLTHSRRTPLAIAFTDPNIATVGASFAELTDACCDFAIGEVDFSNQGRARVLRQNRGLLRLYAERGTGRLLGAEMAAPRAEHLAHLLAWAIQSGIDVETALAMPFYHPVIEEGLRTALRDLSLNLGRQSDNPPCSIDCGPGA